MINVYKILENKWFNLPKQLRFLLVGGFNTLFSYFLFLALTLIINYNLSLFLTYFVCINLSIFTMRYYVFCAQGNWAEQYTKALSTYLGMVVVNYLALWLMIECWLWKVWVAQAVFTLISTFVIYQLHNRINFRT